MNGEPTRPGLFARARSAARDAFVAGLDQAERNEWPYDFRNTAHDGQLPPECDWRIWLMMAGRGFGKTRAGAEWVRDIAETNRGARVALVAASLGEARAVMVEGDSGILACSPPDRRPAYEPSLRRLRWANGAQATLFSAAEPESLRGPQHSHAWCDELAKWSNARHRAISAWDNLQLGLRLGPNQQVLATTTPRARRPPPGVRRSTSKRERRSERLSMQLQHCRLFATNDGNRKRLVSFGCHGKGSWLRNPFSSRRKSGILATGPADCFLATLWVES